MPSKINLLRAFACLSTFTFGGAQAIMIALYPAIAFSLKLDLTTVIYCVSVGTFLFLFGSPYWSNTDNYLSRNSVLLIGTGGLLLSFMMVVFLINSNITSHLLIIILFLISQLLYGLIASATVPAAQALQLQLVNINQVVSASFINTMSLNLGRVVGYALIVFFYENFQNILLSYLVLIFIVFLIIFSCHKYHHVYSIPTSQKSSWRKEAKDIRWIIAIALLYACFLETLLFSLAGTIKQQFDLDTTLAGGFSAKLLLILSVGIFLVQSIGKQFIKESWRIGMMIGVLTLFLGSALLIHTSSFTQLWIAIGNIVIGLGLLPALYLSLLRTNDESKNYGKRAGIIASAHTIGYTAGGFIAGYALNQLTSPIGYYLAAIALFLGFSCFKQIIAMHQYNNNKVYEYDTETQRTC